MKRGCRPGGQHKRAPPVLPAKLAQKVEPQHRTGAWLCKGNVGPRGCCPRSLGGCRTGHKRGGEYFQKEPQKSEWGSPASLGEYSWVSCRARFHGSTVQLATRSCGGHSAGREHSNRPEHIRLTKYPGHAMEAPERQRLSPWLRTTLDPS